MSKSLKHQGMHSWRLQPWSANPREVAFIRQWRVEQRNYSLLKKLVPDATQRDATVAATVIQWLGSNVGLSFISDVLRNSPESARHIRARLPQEKKTKDETMTTTKGSLPVKQGTPLCFYKQGTIEHITRKMDTLCDALEILLPTTGMRLHDHADGCEGHFCVERNCPHTVDCVEYWNDYCSDWTAAGTVYNRIEALYKIAELLVSNEGEQ